MCQDRVQWPTLAKTAAKFRVLQKKEVSSTAELPQIFRLFGGFVWLAIQAGSQAVIRSVSQL